MPAEGILPALEAGQRLFGENYVQESKAKWPALRERYPDVELHLVGPLQSNKAREAVELFDVIHSLDRLSLAAALAKEIARVGPRAEAPDPGQYRRRAAEGRRLAGRSSTPCSSECRETHGLAIQGLMCIPPAEDPPSAAFRPARPASPSATTCRSSPWA